MMTARWSCKEAWDSTMENRLNRKLLETVEFRSDALGPLAMVVTRFTGLGSYRVAVMHNGHPVGDTSFEVCERSTVPQLNFDLAELERAARSRPEGCACTDGRPSDRVVSPSGNCLFHASSGSGYSAVVLDPAGKTVFNNAKGLNPGDFFATSFLRPGEYSMMNATRALAGAITVGLPRDAEKRMRTLETSYVDLGPKGFVPEGVSLISTQGFVVRIQTEAGVLIKLRKAASTEPSKRRTAVHWNSHQPAKKPE
jgi:hypothetical protein